MKIRILSGMMVIILAVILAGCTSGDNAKPFKEDYGVFRGIARDEVEKLGGYKTVVIDADYFTAKDIAIN